MKKKIKSRIGLTLVELIVTIAILGMVAGMGVGMVGSAIKNYSTASTTAREQETALAVESFILTAVRTSSSVQSVSTTAGSFPSHDATMYYLYFMNGTLRTMRNEIEKKGVNPVVTTISYEGVGEINFTIRKQKSVKDDPTDEKKFIYLYYEIKMREGYTLRGSAVLNNAPSDYITAQKDDKYIENGISETITFDDSSKALAIVK